MSKLNNRYWLETEHFFVIIPPPLHMIPLIMILSLKLVFLVLKSSPNLSCFIINPKLYTLISIHSFIGRMSKLNNRYWLENEHFFVITPPPLHMIPLIMILSLKLVFLVLKSSPNLNCFVINPKLNTLISLSRIKKVLTCILVNAILFNSFKMNNSINSPPF